VVTHSDSHNGTNLSPGEWPGALAVVPEKRASRFVARNKILQFIQGSPPAPPRRIPVVGRVRLVLRERRRVRKLVRPRIDGRFDRKDAGHGLAGARPAVLAETHDRVLALFNSRIGAPLDPVMRDRPSQYRLTALPVLSG